MQATPPVPRKTANNQAGQSAKDHRQADTQQTNGASPAVISQSNSSPQGNSHTNPATPAHQEKTIRVPELPTVNVRTDGWTKTYVFFTGGLFLVGIFGVVAALKTLNAIKRQADLMEGGVHVDGVRVIEFEEGKQPIFFVKIMNSGQIAAANVSVSMKVDLVAPTTESSTEYLHDQSVTIPAHGANECFIRLASILKAGELAELDSGGMTLRVSGRITRREQKVIEYCYKYNQWTFGIRPSEFPMFRPCDFDTRTALNAVAKPKGFSAVVRVGNLTAKAENPPPETSKEPSDPN